jgi:CRP/FNR family transcriptional regulator, cyclic AMP receptor protein
MALGRRKGKPEVVATLQDIPLFSGCTKSELNQLAKIVKEVEFPAGQTICQEGARGIGMHIVVEGYTKVQIGGRTRRKLGPGAFFGEIALLDGGARSATVVAVTDVKTLAVPQWEFKSMLEEHPTLALRMLEETCRRLRITDASLST